MIRIDEIFNKHVYRDDSIALIWLKSTETSKPIANFPRADYEQRPTDEATMRQLTNLFAFAYEKGRKAGYNEKAVELRELLNL